MGNPASKYGEELPKNESSEEGSIPSTPIFTSRSPKLTELDPRSPSSDFIRTPLQFLTNDEPEEIQVQTKVLPIDPRSPTTEFKRTPIIVETKLPIKIHNKNLDNARNELNAVTPRASKGIPPKLLESSPITSKTSSKRKSLVGLLETNIDYTETDLDQVRQEKSQTEIFQSKDVDPQPDFVCIPEQIIKEINELDLSGAKDESVSNSDESVQELDVPELENVLPDLILANKQPECYETERNVKEFDNKLTNLIYEDEETVVTIPKLVKAKEGERTPLGTRDCNKESRKSVSKLRVSDKPLKQKYGVSKIPVFKEKRLKNGNVQCENTPPRRNSSEQVTIKTRKSQWDSDNTLII